MHQGLGRNVVKAGEGVWWWNWLKWKIFDNITDITHVSDRLQLCEFEKQYHTVSYSISVYLFASFQCCRCTSHLPLFSCFLFSHALLWRTFQHAHFRWNMALELQWWSGYLAGMMNAARCLWQENYQYILVKGCSCSPFLCRVWGTKSKLGVAGKFALCWGNQKL